MGLNLYRQIFKTMIPVSSLEAAEMTKLLENIYRSVNIGLVNEMKIISEVFGLNIYEIISAAKTKPFGFSAFYPGPGVGGHCIPVDPFYLAWKSKKLGVSARFIELAGKVNDSMPKKIVTKILNYKFIDSILILGVAYKKNVDDYRESPILKIFDLLRKNNIKVEYHDPYIPEIRKTRKYTFNKKSINISKKRLNSFDAVILGTDHDKFNYNLILKYSKKIFDLRGRLSMENQKKVINL